MTRFKSLDTNILVYALNSSCPEFPGAAAILRSALESPSGWILADQVLIELYVTLRNPKVLRKPLPATEAFDKVSYLRDRCGFYRCCYQDACWQSLSPRLENQLFPYRRTYNAVLAVTLLRAGVTTLYTRNVKDFEGFGFEELIDPFAW